MGMTFKESHKLETFNSLVTISVEGLKASLLINGGAMVALLAFLGQSPLGPQMAKLFRWPMGLFAVGLCLATAAFLFSYCTQLTLYNEAFSLKKTHRKYLNVGLLFFILSIGAFASGAGWSVFAFSQQVEKSESKEVKPEPTTPHSTGSTKQEKKN